jgi:hypothetical protein
MYHGLQSGRMLALSNDITQQTALHPKHYLPIFSGSQIVQAPECSAPVNIWHGYHHESPSEVLYHLRQKILSYPKLQEPPKICQGASKQCASDMKLLFTSCEEIAISQLYHWETVQRV